VNPYTLGRRDWNELALKVHVAGPADEIAAFDEQRREPSVTAVAFCRKTNARQAVALERSSLDPSRWTGTLELARENFREKVTLTAILTGQVDGLPARWLAASDEWQLYFDEPTVPPIEGTLRVKWAHFKGDHREPVVPDDAADEPFYVALEEKPPIVLLSKDFKWLPGLLSDKPGRPAGERALRDAEYRRIATAAWTEVFNVSVASIRQPEDEDAEPEWPEEDWQEQALRSLLPLIYPSLTESEALTQAYRDFQGDGALTLQALSQIAVSKEIGAGRSLRRNLDRLNTTGSQ
jgi:hypothetical protein